MKVSTYFFRLLISDVQYLHSFIGGTVKMGRRPSIRTADSHILIHYKRRAGTSKTHVPCRISKPQRRHSYFAGTRRNRTKRARNNHPSSFIRPFIHPSVRPSVRRAYVFFLLHIERILRNTRTRACTGTRTGPCVLCVHIYIYIGLSFGFRI